MPVYTPGGQLLGEYVTTNDASWPYYYLQDGFGSEIALTDQNDTVVNTYSYDAKGNTMLSTGPVPNVAGYHQLPGMLTTGGSLDVPGHPGEMGPNGDYWDPQDGFFDLSMDNYLQNQAMRAQEGLDNSSYTESFANFLGIPDPPAKSGGGGPCLNPSYRGYHSSFAISYQQYYLPDCFIGELNDAVVAGVGLLAIATAIAGPEAVVPAGALLGAIGVAVGTIDYLNQLCQGHGVYLNVVSSPVFFVYPAPVC